uniref:RNA 2',3'-cyclic phosphodiesterase n=1 Tax=Eiseniibacteriota bacterium TaxID=2212470 RepID=A0A832I2L1_UNCEI
MRIFLAVFPPPATQRLAFDVINALRAPGDGVSWVKRENLHYTLRFLGELGDDGLRRAIEAAREAAASVPRFEAVLGAPGAFPNARRARVLWLGLAAGEAPFERLAAALEASLARRGFAPEGRAFTAHLTIGRVREPSRDWTPRLAAPAATVGAPAARFAVDRLLVIESRLDPRGSVYTERAAAPLAPADGG